MEELQLKYGTGYYICYSRKKGTQSWKLCKYPKWFSNHEYKLESKGVDPLKWQQEKEQWEDQFAKLDRASI